MTKKQNLDKCIVDVLTAIIVLKSARLSRSRTSMYCNINVYLIFETVFNCYIYFYDLVS